MDAWLNLVHSLIVFISFLHWQTLDKTWAEFSSLGVAVSKIVCTTLCDPHSLTPILNGPFECKNLTLYGENYASIPVNKIKPQSPREHRVATYTALVFVPDYNTIVYEWNVY